ncbi:MAG: DUF2264 domain-containing protein [bacterium]
MKPAFEVPEPDYDLSPYTGMTRRHYVDLAKYVLTRAFTHVDSVDTPISFPTVPGKTYPQPGAPDWRHRSHEFEALERTFTLGGPLLHVDPEIEIRGISLKEYYRKQFYNAFTPGHPNSLPRPEDLPDATYQFTCEFGGLFKTLLMLPDVLWPWYTEEEKNEMLPTISAWAHHRTTQNNWRIFNIVTLSFLKKNGYEIDDQLLKDHLLWVASYHSGDGWYLEQTYNYYTISLFIVYGTIWNRAFGDEHYPEIAAVIEDSAHKLMRTYTNFFARDGHISMWARSICYRTWVSGGFPVSFMLTGEQPLDPGWARRLCSGSLLQFATREDFYENDVPSLGFYGHREFVLQNYSCPGSPFIMFLPFIALGLPEDSPFWTATENEGMWETLGEKSHVEVLENPGLVLVNHGKTGTSEIVPGKTYYQDPNYSKLVYNTHFLWEDQNPAGGTAMEYAFRSLDPRDLRGEDINFYLTGIAVENDSERNARYTHSESMLYNGFRDGVLYRQAIMRKPPNNGVGYIIDLAEIAIPGGVIRADRSRMAFEHELTLGHFGLPHVDGNPAKVESFEFKNRRILTAVVPGRKLALIAYQGWDKIDHLVHDGRNAESAESTVLYAYRKRTQQNPPMELMIMVLLHGTDDEPWTEAELDPIKSITTMDVTPTNSALGATITLRDGSVREIDFKDIDGFRSC